MSKNLRLHKKLLESLFLLRNSNIGLRSWLIHKKNNFLGAKSQILTGYTLTQVPRIFLTTHNNTNASYIYVWRNFALPKMACFLALLFRCLKTFGIEVPHVFGSCLASSLHSLWSNICSTKLSQSFRVLAISFRYLDLYQSCVWDDPI